MSFEASSPLLVDNNNFLKLESADSFNNDGCSPSTISLIYEEIKHLYRVAFPLIITGLLVYSKSMISMLFMGKMGKKVLAGGSLSIAIANISGYSVLLGLSTGMEGISCQAYGARQSSVMTQIMYRTVMILLLISIPISIFWLNIKPLLLLFGQDSTISCIAATHLGFCFPDLLFLSFINPLKIYLRSQNITHPIIISASFALLCNAPINYLMVYKFGFGIGGIGAATCITDFILFCTLVLYTYRLSVKRREEEEGGEVRSIVEEEVGGSSSSSSSSSSSCIQEWKQIIYLAIPSCLSVCLEWWWYEIMIILSGLLPNATESLASIGILIQATSIAYIFPSSLSSAVSTRVGNSLGANDPKLARNSSLVALLCAFFTSLFSLAFMTGMSKTWGRIFTTDEAVISLTAMVLPVVGLCELGNCPQTTVCGVLRGSTRPSLGAAINFGSFYGVGLPMAVIMAFVLGKGFVGLWLGLLSAQFVCTLTMIIVSWEKNRLGHFGPPKFQKPLTEKLRG